MTTTKQIQQALIDAGFSVGKAGADGIWGRDSIAGMRSFQKQRSLLATGVADAASLAALFPAGARLSTDPAWYVEATRLMGTAEIAGPKHSSIIMRWAERLGIWYPSDETAWCGLFVAHCIGLTLPAEPMPANVLGARNWAKFGKPAKPSVGAIMVFWRGSKSGWQGHVGFYAGETATAYLIRGGNQGNKVSDAWIGKERLIDVRWPSTGPAPVGGKRILAASGALSRDEA